MPAADDLARLGLMVSGQVQGVFFRASAADRARALGLSGFARNLADGAVEIVAEGRRANLRILAQWARRGPRAARVDHVHEQWSDFLGEFDTFSVR